MSTRTPPTDRSFRKIAFLFAIVFVGGAMLMGSAWQALADPDGDVTALTHSTCTAFPDAANVPGAVQNTATCTALPDETLSTATTTYSTTSSSTRTSTTETTKTTTHATSTSRAGTSTATTTSKAPAPPVARSTVTGGEQRATTSARTAGPIPRAVDAGQNEASSWQVPVGGALITLGALGAALALRRSTTER